jgi:superfamily II DNA or RNA helicase
LSISGPERPKEASVGDYDVFLATKLRAVAPTGFETTVDSPHLFAFQRDLVRWALRRGRAAIFADTGLGKSRMEVEWSRQVCERSGGDVLILAPLAVAAQTVREAAAIGVRATLCRDGADVRPGVNVTNYDRLHRFDPRRFAGVVLDESSCIKHFDSKMLRTLLEAFTDAVYKLAATATPAPNDYAELGTHAEFLGVCSRPEMLAEYFVHDSGDTQTWRLKGHAQTAFWSWVASWAALVRKPSDLGYDDGGYALPPLRVQHHVVDVPGLEVKDSMDLQERRAARKASLPVRVAACADLVNRERGEQWLVWGALNAETEGLVELIPGAVEVRGPDEPDDKEAQLLAFAEGRTRVLVTKASIAGWGLNFQRCARMAFVGVDDSFESYYQAVRRCWRFRQEREVEVHIFASAAERVVVDNLARKEEDARRMAEALSGYTRDAVREQVRRAVQVHQVYEPKRRMTLPKFRRSA